MYDSEGFPQISYELLADLLAELRGDHTCTFSKKGHSSLWGRGMHRKNFFPLDSWACPNQPYIILNITTFLQYPASATADHSLFSTRDALGQTPMALQQKKNMYFIPYACLDGFSQGSTSYDLHLDMVHVLCNQAEGRKVSCNAETVSVYRKH